MNRRVFHLMDGTSNKFWAITLNGTEFTVEWGRIGTNGQTKTKSFGGEAEARKQYDLLIAEKTGKGYTEVGGGTTVISTAPAASPKTTKATAAAKSIKSAKAAAPALHALPHDSAATIIPASLEINKTIHLNARDWQFVTWRKRTPLPRPAPREFNQARLVEMVAKIRKGTYGWDWHWEKLDIPDVIGKAEAEFWLTVMSMPSQTHGDKRLSPHEVAAKAGEMMFDGQLSEGAVLAKLLAGAEHGRETIVRVAANLLAPSRLIEMMLEDRPRRRSRSPFGWRFGTDSIAAFRRSVLPYLTEAEFEAMRTRVESEVVPQNWPTDLYERPSAAFFLGAMCGLHEALLRVVSQIEDDQYTQSGWDHAYYHQTQLVVLGLGSPTLVEAHMRRLKLRLNHEDHIRGWLATTEFASLEYLRDSILLETNAGDATRQVECMALVEAPEAAPLMLELKLASRAPKAAREWLEKYPACAIAGLASSAAGHGKLADAAIEHLAGMKRKGFAALIAEAAKGNERLTREVVEKEDKVLPELTETPAWLVGEKAARRKLPTWASADELPPLAVAGQRLKAEHVDLVLRSLAQYPPNAPDGVIKGLRAEGDAELNDAFAWRLFTAWLSDGAPSKEKWAMLSVGHLGGDKSALLLTPMIRVWPGESQHQRAVSGLECLRSIGTDTALMCLNGIAQKLKFKGLKAKAQEMMEGIAADRKMTRPELEDRIVPDCDLDERGTRVFDFGARRFKFVLGPEMKAMVKDEAGKVRANLPAPNSKDDAEKAAAAAGEWALLKKQIKEVAKVQAVRLEQAMVTGRRWERRDFETLLLQHPLMVNLVRLLVWGGYDEAGAPAGTFRVTEDQTCADEMDNPRSLDGFTHIGIMHALHLQEELSRKWGEVFGDYEIIPPFKQLGRPVYALEGEEAKATDLARWTRVEIPATALVGTLERLAWDRGIPLDGGVFNEHSKQFPGAGVTAVVEYEIGVPVGYMEGWEDQRISRCFFVPGMYTPKMYPEHANAVALGKVDPVAISEVLADLTMIASKGK